MNWFTGLIVYVLVWWVTLFAVLPLRVVPAEPDDLGHTAGAPKQPWLRAQGSGYNPDLGRDLAGDLCAGSLAVAELSRLVR